MAKSIKCDRCFKKYRGRGAWNGTFRAGVLVGSLCPRCQTPDENAEAEINEATLTYASGGGGRILGLPK